MYVLHTTVNGTEYFLAHRRLFPVLRDDSSIIPSHHTTTPSGYCTAMYYYAGVGQMQMLGQAWFEASNLSPSNPLGSDIVHKPKLNKKEK